MYLKPICLDNWLYYSFHIKFISSYYKLQGIHCDMRISWDFVRFRDRILLGAFYSKHAYNEARGQHCPQHNVLLTDKTKLNSMALVRERTIPTEQPPPVGEASANFCG
jgi:hypothetical protein